MTFLDLAKQILAMPPERQQDTATVTCEGADESFPVTALREANDDGVLDPGHFVMAIDA